MSGTPFSIFKFCLIISAPFSLLIRDDYKASWPQANRLNLILLNGLFFYSEDNPKTKIVKSGEKIERQTQ